MTVIPSLVSDHRPIELPLPRTAKAETYSIFYSDAIRHGLVIPGVMNQEAASGEGNFETQAELKAKIKSY